MSVCRNLLHGERHRFNTASLAQSEATTLMERKSATQVREGKGSLPIAAVGCADQGEQRIVLGDQEQLPFAKHPAGRSKIATEHSDFTNVGLCHVLSLVLRRENPLQRDAETQCQKRLHV